MGVQDCVLARVQRPLRHLLLRLHRQAVGERHMLARAAGPQCRCQRGTCVCACVCVCVCVRVRVHVCEALILADPKRMLSLMLSFLLTPNFFSMCFALLLRAGCIQPKWHRLAVMLKRFNDPVLRPQAWPAQIYARRACSHERCCL